MGEFIKSRRNRAGQPVKVIRVDANSEVIDKEQQEMDEISELTQEQKDLQDLEKYYNDIWRSMNAHLENGGDIADFADMDW